MKWDSRRMEEVCLLITDGKHGDCINQENSGFYFISAKDVRNWNIHYDEARQITPDDFFDTHRRTKFEPFDVVVVSTGANIGDTAIAKDIEKTYKTTFQKSVAILKANKTELSPFYLAYFLKNSRVTLHSISSGSAQKNLLLKDLRNLIIPLPPLPTQRKIANILSAYDDLIENNLKRIKLLEEKAFLRYKMIVRSEKLEEKSIEELANVIMGQSPTSDTYNEENEGLPFHQGVTNFTNYFVEHKIFCKSPIKIAEEGDILFSVRAPVGRINFTNDKICIGRGLCAFRSKKGFQNYFYHQLKEFFFTEDVIGNGAIFNAVTKVELMAVKLKTPSDQVQLEFEKEAQLIYNLILNLNQQNTKLREARDILLPRLMNGEITV